MSISVNYYITIAHGESIIRRNATHCISPYAIVVCVCVSVCVCFCACVSVCVCVCVCAACVNARKTV